MDKNISILALNPIQNLFDTVNAARGTRPDIEATRESYPRVRGMAPRTQPDPQKLDFMRTVPGTPAETAGKAAECGGHHHGVHDMAAHVPSRPT